MEYPNNATTEDKIFLKQCYLDNLESMKADLYKLWDDLVVQSKTVKERMDLVNNDIRRINQEIEKVENEP
jgi:cob(I)alamin adenosyltransferase